MKTDPVLLLSAIDGGTSATSIGVFLDQISLYSVQVISSGTQADGTVSIQASNDNVAPASSGDPAANVTNWATLASPAAITFTGAQDKIADSALTGVRWVRVAYTRTGTSSGGSAVTVKFNGKEV